jgi:hypothetical protein
MYCKVTHISFKYLLINCHNVSVDAYHHEGANIYWTVSMLSQERVALTRHYADWVALLLFIRISELHTVPQGLDMLMQAFVVFLSPSKTIPGYYLKQGHSHLLYHIFQCDTH